MPARRHRILLLNVSLVLIATQHITLARDRSEVDLKVDKSTLAVELPTNQPAEWRTGVIDHLQLSATAVSQYLGGFPVPNVSIIVSAQPGHEVNGKEFEDDRVTLTIGEQITPAELNDDWVFTHELFHLAFPDMDDRYKWMNEGLSDYLEPIARAAAGQISAEEAWQGFVEGMPKGQPKAGDQGLDRTHTWGRTYWGGCAYWLLADVRIREQTAGKKTLADAIKAVLAAGGTGDQEWPIEKAITTADAATGTHVLTDLHDELGLHPKTIDFDSLWRSLGVEYNHGKITFNDTAPQAAMRKAMTAKN